MKLTYRGNDYEQSTVPMEMADSRLQGSYRGRLFQFTYPRHIPVPQPTHDLRYRGVGYHTDEVGAVTGVGAIAQDSPAEMVHQRSSLLANASQFQKKQSGNLAHVHQLNVQRRLQHRLEVARENGDETLVRQLEQELQSM